MRFGMARVLLKRAVGWIETLFHYEMRAGRPRYFQEAWGCFAKGVRLSNKNRD